MKMNSATVFFLQPVVHNTVFPLLQARQKKKTHTHKCKWMVKWKIAHYLHYRRRPLSDWIPSRWCRMLLIHPRPPEVWWLSRWTRTPPTSCVRLPVAVAAWTGCTVTAKLCHFFPWTFGVTIHARTHARPLRHHAHVCQRKSFNLRGSNLPQLQESRGELVADKAAGVWVTLLLAACWDTDVCRVKTKQNPKKNRAFFSIVLSNL